MDNGRNLEGRKEDKADISVVTVVVKRRTTSPDLITVVVVYYQAKLTWTYRKQTAEVLFIIFCFLPPCQPEIQYNLLLGHRVHWRQAWLHWQNPLPAR
jgi:hypothetical protein